MKIPNARDVMRHAQEIEDKHERLRFLERKMDESTALNASLWDMYSLLVGQTLTPLKDAAEGVCAYDWSENDEDAVETITILRKAV
jgi:hypothetical protein